MRYEYRPAKNVRYRLEFEGAATFGAVEEVPSLYAEPFEECVDPTESNLDLCDKTRRRHRDIQRFGYALEFDAQHEAVHKGIHSLAAVTATARWSINRSGINQTHLGSKDEALTSFYLTGTTT